MAGKRVVHTALGLATTGCVDDSYDMSKDIDMTMGIGADGLDRKSTRLNSSHQD